MQPGEARGHHRERRARGASPCRLVPGRRHHCAGFHGNGEPGPPRSRSYVTAQAAGHRPRSAPPGPDPAHPGPRDRHCPAPRDRLQQHPGVPTLQPTSTTTAPRPCSPSCPWPGPPSLPSTARTTAPGWLLPGWRRAQEPLACWCHRENLHRERPEAAGEVGTWGHARSTAPASPGDPLFPPQPWPRRLEGVKSQGCGVPGDDALPLPAPAGDHFAAAGLVQPLPGSCHPVCGLCGQGQAGTPERAAPSPTHRHRHRQSLPSGTKGVTLPSHGDKQDTARSIQCTPGLPVPSSPAQPGAGEAV